LSDAIQIQFQEEQLENLKIWVYVSKWSNCLCRTRIKKK
jgi:hypothetical protein